MALKGRLTIYGDVALPNAYARITSITGGKQAGAWQGQFLVLPDAALVDMLTAAQQRQQAAQGATYEAGAALARDRKNAALEAAFSAAAAAEHQADADVGAATKALNDAPALYQGIVSAKYDANVENPYLLLYAALKNEARFAGFVDA